LLRLLLRFFAKGEAKQTSGLLASPDCFARSEASMQLCLLFFATYLGYA
jgi:hypothetical protein